MVTILEGIGTRSEDGYSYKFKKSGFHTQVCIDMNGMVLFISESAPCKNNTDGAMLKKMRIQDKIEKYDSIAVDGGYKLFIKQIVEESNLKERNFCCPIRKIKNMELSDEETKYNEMFGSFRSLIEGFFGEIGTIFEKFNNRRSIRSSDYTTFNLQFKLACLLLNVKKFVDLGVIKPSSQHLLWLEDRFDYSHNVDSDIESHMITTLKETSSSFDEMSKCQNRILDGVNYVDCDEEGDELYEVDKIISHK